MSGWDRCFREEWGEDNDTQVPNMSAIGHGHEATQDRRKRGLDISK